MSEKLITAEIARKMTRKNIDTLSEYVNRKIKKAIKNGEYSFRITKRKFVTEETYQILLDAGFSIDGSVRCYEMGDDWYGYEVRWDNKG
jgi:hypothetical protein